MDSALVNRRGIPFEYDDAERDYYEETIEELINKFSNPDEMAELIKLMG